ncbi:MAG: hypothetical protein ACOY46_13580 [Bacillota bacterium]
MKEKNDKGKKEELSLEELIDKLKESLLIEGSKKANEDDIGSMVRQWLNEDKRH